MGNQIEDKEIEINRKMGKFQPKERSENSISCGNLRNVRPQKSGKAQEKKAKKQGEMLSVGTLDCSDCNLDDDDDYHTEELAPQSEQKRRSKARQKERTISDRK